MSAAEVRPDLAGEVSRTPRRRTALPAKLAADGSDDDLEPAGDRDSLGDTGLPEDDATDA